MTERETPIIDGLTIGLLAVGLVLVYKSNRFLNLAHAQLGTLSALFVAKWVLDWRWSWWVAPARGSSASACPGSSPRCSKGVSTPRSRPTPALAPRAARRGTPSGRRAAMR